MPSSLHFVATAAILTGTIFMGGLADRRIAEPLAIPLDQIGNEVAGWTAVKDSVLPAPTLHALDPTAYLARTYQRGAQQLDLFIAFYSQQRAGESMHSPKHCLPGAGWEIWQLGSAKIPVNGKQFLINKYSISNSGSRMLMFYWYQSKDRVIADEYLGKLLLARDTIMTGHTAGSIVRVMLPDVRGASEDGEKFASAIIPLMSRCIGSGSVLN